MKKEWLYDKEKIIVILFILILFYSLIQFFLNTNFDIKKENLIVANSIKKLENSFNNFELNNLFKKEDKITGDVKKKTKGKKYRQVDPSSGEYAKNRLIVKFKDNEDAKNLKKYIENKNKLKQSGLTKNAIKDLKNELKELAEDDLIKPLKEIEVDNIRNIFTNFKNEPNYEETDFGKVYLIEFPEGTDIVQWGDKFYKFPDKIEYVDLDYIFELSYSPNDPYYSESNTGYPDNKRQWTLYRFNMGRAWDISKGDNVVVAVIDNGFNYTHEDLTNKMLENCVGGCPLGTGYDFSTCLKWIINPRTCQITSERDNDPSDNLNYINLNTGHGTKVAGILGAETDNNKGIAGMCPNCKIMPIKNGVSFAYVSDFVDSIKYAADYNSNIVSMSFGANSLCNEQTINSALDYAYSKKIILVASSGNYNEGSLVCPARHKHVIGVGGANSNNERYVDNNNFFIGSNYGKELDVMGFFHDVWTTSPDIVNFNQFGTYKDFGGTSAATPMVSALAGLMLSISPSSPGPDTITSIIQDTADDLQDNGKDMETGYGLINPVNALTKIKSLVPSSPAVADLNQNPNDGNESVTISLDNFIYVSKSDGNFLDKWKIEDNTDDQSNPYAKSDGYVAVGNSVAMADIIETNINPGLEIVVGTKNVDTGKGKVFMYNVLSKSLIFAKETNAQILSSPSIEDIDGDNINEIIVTGKIVDPETPATNNNGAFYVLNKNGVIIAEKEDLIGGVYNSASVGDINADGEKEIIVGTDKGEIYAFNLVKGIISDSLELLWEKSLGSNIKGFIAISDLDGDGKVEVVVTSVNGIIYILDGESGNTLSFFSTSYGTIKTSPAVADLDGDKKQEIVVLYDTGDVYAFKYENKVTSQFWQGDNIANSETRIFSDPIVADLDNNPNNGLEIAIGSNEGFIYILKNNGIKHSSSPLNSGTSGLTSPSVDKTNTENKIVASTYDGSVKILSIPTAAKITAENNIVDWPTSKRNLQRTSSISNDGLDLTLLPIGDKDAKVNKELEFKIKAIGGNYRKNGNVQYIFGMKKASYDGNLDLQDNFKLDAIPRSGFPNQAKFYFDPLPNHNQIGEYYINFTVSNGTFEDFEIIKLTIRDPPTISITVDQPVIDSGSSQKLYLDVDSNVGPLSEAKIFYYQGDNSNNPETYDCPIPPNSMSLDCSYNTPSLLDGLYHYYAVAVDSDNLGGSERNPPEDEVKSFLVGGEDRGTCNGNNGIYCDNDIETEINCVLPGSSRINDCEINKQQIIKTTNLKSSYVFENNLYIGKDGMLWFITPDYLNYFSNIYVELPSWCKDLEEGCPNGGKGGLVSTTIDGKSSSELGYNVKIQRDEEWWTYRVGGRAGDGSDCPPYGAFCLLSDNSCGESKYSYGGAGSDAQIVMNNNKKYGVKSGGRRGDICSNSNIRKRFGGAKFGDSAYMRGSYISIISDQNVTIEGKISVSGWPGDDGDNGKNSISCADRDNDDEGAGGGGGGAGSRAGSLEIEAMNISKIGDGKLLAEGGAGGAGGPGGDDRDDTFLYGGDAGGGGGGGGGGAGGYISLSASFVHPNFDPDSKSKKKAISVKGGNGGSGGTGGRSTGRWALPDNCDNGINGEKGSPGQVVVTIQSKSSFPFIPESTEPSNIQINVSEKKVELYLDNNLVDLSCKKTKQSKKEKIYKGAKIIQECTYSNLLSDGEHEYYSKLTKSITKKTKKGKITNNYEIITKKETFVVGDHVSPQVQIKLNPEEINYNQPITIKSTSTDNVKLKYTDIYFDDSLKRSCWSNSKNNECIYTAEDLDAGSHDYYAKSYDQVNNEGSSETKSFTLPISIIQTPKKPLINEEVKLKSTLNNIDELQSWIVNVDDAETNCDINNIVCNYANTYSQPGEHTYYSLATYSNGKTFRDPPEDYQDVGKKSFIVESKPEITSLTITPENPVSNEIVKIKVTASDNSELKEIKIHLLMEINPGVRVEINNKICSFSDVSSGECELELIKLSIGNYLVYAEAVDNHYYRTRNPDYGGYKPFTFGRGFILKTVVHLYNLDKPKGIAVDSKGNTYISDIGSSKIYKFRGSSLIESFGSEGEGQDKFKSLEDIYIFNDEIYTIDGGSKNYIIKKFDNNFNFISYWDKFGNQAIKKPKDIYVDNKYIYVLDSINNIIIFDYNSEEVKTLNINNVDGLDVKVTSFTVLDNQLFVYDTKNDRLLKFINLAYNSKIDSTTIQNPDADFTNIQSIILDSHKYLYTISKGTKTKLQKFNGNSLFLSFGGKGEKDYEFKNPEDITLDNDNNLYVLDSKLKLLKIYFQQR